MFAGKFPAKIAVRAPRMVETEDVDDEENAAIDEAMRIAESRSRAPSPRVPPLQHRPAQQQQNQQQQPSDLQNLTGLPAGHQPPGSHPAPSCSSPAPALHRSKFLQGALFPPSPASVNPRQAEGGPPPSDPRTPGDSGAGRVQGGAVGGTSGGGGGSGPGTGGGGGGGGGCATQLQSPRPAVQPFHVRLTVRALHPKSESLNPIALPHSDRLADCFQVDLLGLRFKYQIWSGEEPGLTELVRPNRPRRS